MPNPITHFPHSTLELLFPHTCPVCSQPVPDSRDTLCPQCWLELQENLQTPACPTCGHSVGPYAVIENRCHRCQRTRPYVTRTVRVGEYDGPLRQLVLALEFRRQSQLDRFLGSLLADLIVGAPELQSIDLLVPVPLHWRRRWWRSYNQSDLLARAAAVALKHQGRRIPIHHDLLRIRPTPPQTTLTPSDRLRNLRNAFATRPRAPYADKHICLIDDVATTGTTLRTAARTLKQAGAKKVSAAVLAVAANT